MNDTAYVVLVVVLMALTTLALRATPFVAGRWLGRHAIVHRLGDSLPLAIMSLLLLDTLAGEARSHPGLPWPELVATLVILLLQWRFRRTLASIAAGTALYMLLRAW